MQLCYVSWHFICRLFFIDQKFFLIRATWQGFTLILKKNTRGKYSWKKGHLAHQEAGGWAASVPPPSPMCWWAGGEGTGKWPFYNSWQQPSSTADMTRGIHFPWIHFLFVCAISMFTSLDHNVCSVGIFSINCHLFFKWLNTHLSVTKPTKAVKSLTLRGRI